MAKPSVASLAELDKDEFIAVAGLWYEKAPWVAEGAFAKCQKDSSIFDSCTTLHACMKQVVEDAGVDRQLELLNNHPDLAGRAAIAGELTEESKLEQARAGLGSLTPTEMSNFQVQLNVH
jgi:2-oxo-4-hydroxy-4-carboxy-5-ureidoimidazoline decarboxylase